MDVKRIDGHANLYFFFQIVIEYMIFSYSRFVIVNRIVGLETEVFIVIVRHIVLRVCTTVFIFIESVYSRQSLQECVFKVM